jgi:hypothetical protein
VDTGIRALADQRQPSKIGVCDVLWEPDGEAGEGARGRVRVSAAKMDEPHRRQNGCGEERHRGKRRWIGDEAASRELQ